MTRTLFFSAILTLTAGFGTTIFAQDGSSPVQTGAVVVQAPTAEAVGPNAAPAGVSNDYVIGPLDILRIDVWRDADLTRTVAVRPDGRFAMPLLGEIQASGLTPLRLKSTLTQALMEYITAPEVTVTVMQVNSKNYDVTGAVGRAGSYPLVTEISVFKAINLAGGFSSQWADKKHVIIMRGDERMEFNYEDYAKGKNLDKNPNILLQPGDTVLVRE